MKVKKKRRDNDELNSKDNAIVCPKDKVRRNSDPCELSALLQRSYQKCEFCEEVCFNRYSMLVHNAKHIIIPLLKQQIHQCVECLHHFTSVESLEWHTINKHPNITKEDYVPELLQSFVKKEPMIAIRTPFEINESIANKESLLQSFVKREPIMVLKKEEISLNDSEIYEISDSDSGNDDVIVKTEVDDKNFDADDELNYNSNRIKDKLQFEEEVPTKLPYVGLINDLTTDCKVDLEMFDENWINSIQNAGSKEISNGYPQKNVWEQNKIVLGQKVKRTDWKSVHYDELVESGAVGCEKCGLQFPSRYEAIIHETTHINLKRPKMPFLCRFCDWYVGTGPMVLKKHHNTKHPDMVVNSQTAQKCEECGLKYFKLKRHRWNYHGEVCSPPSNNDTGPCEQKQNRLSEGKAPRECEEGYWSFNEKIVNVCDLCYLFFRNKVNLNYEYRGELTEQGTRHQCERCQKSFFTLKMVMLRTKKYHKPVEITAYTTTKKKSFTNADRLKNVQQRLKKLKKLNKF